MDTKIAVSHFVAAWAASPFRHVDADPWIITCQSSEIIREALAGLRSEYVRDGDIAVHRSAMLEAGCVLKGPSIIGPNCFVAAGSYLRGGTYLADSCIIGPGSELKSSFVFHRSKLAHFNFVGDSILGADVNVEAGAVIANFRNELEDRRIRFRLGERTIETGVDKFGSLVGDGVRIGANAVIAPGATLLPNMCVKRLALVDQHPDALE